MTKSSTISLHLNAQLVDMTSPAIGADETDPSKQMGEIYGSIMNSNPVDFPVFFPNTGEKWVKWGAYSGGNDQGATNPLAQATRGYSDSFASTVIANIDFDQKLDFITKGLRFKTMFSFKNYSKTTTNRTQGVNRYSIESFSQNAAGEYEYVVKPLGTPSKPVLSTKRTVNGDRRMYFQAYVDYNRSFGDHYLSGMAL
ncbi:MAG: SusC/RagA family protein, partial [Bacteroides sp.]